MKELLGNGYLKLVETWGSDERIVEAARMSTAKGFEGWGPLCASCGDDVFEIIEDLGEEDGVKRSNVNFLHDAVSIDLVEKRTGQVAKCSSCGAVEKKQGDEKLLKYLWTHDHGTPFEMAGATFEAKLPIFVCREWQRHRVPFGYNEASARYAPLPNEDYLPTVERLMAGGGHLTKQAGRVAGADALTEGKAAWWLRDVREHFDRTQDLYERGCAMGVPKELARIVLPVARQTKMRATANLRGWLSFLKLRMAKQAQWEIREYANAVHEVLSRAFPRTLALFDEGRE